MSTTEKKEGATQICKCKTDLICVKVTKTWNNKTEEKLQWQNQSDHKPHFKFAGPGKYDCILPENIVIPETKTITEKVPSLVNADKINSQMDILLELESIVTKKLGDNPNPAKVGMYVKIIFDGMGKID